METPSVDHLLGRLLNDFRHAGDLRGELLWQAALVVLCLVLAWWASGAVERRVAQRVSGIPTGPGVRGFRGVVWPLVTLALLVPARAVLARFYHVNLISLAISLVVAVVLVRLLLYALRRAFPNHPVFAVFGHALAAIVWSALALYITGVLPEIVHGLNGLSLTVGDQTISLWTVLRGLFWVFVAVLASLWLGTVIDNRLMRAASVNTSLRVGLSRLVRAMLILLAVLIVLPLVGIDLTVLSVFGGALGVGLGFGLQKVASNYVSGFVILFERAVSLGDVITVENFLGEVREITTRYVAVRAPDGREAIVPNEKMITETVVNHSLGGRRARITLSLQVGYPSNLQHVLALLRQIALDNTAVLPDPAPLAIVTGFTDSGVAVELWCWVLDAAGGPALVKSDLSIDVLRRFSAEGIELPSAQSAIRIVAGVASAVGMAAAGPPAAKPAGPG